MELKEFVKNVLIELNWALSEVQQESEYTYIYWDREWKHINFDINIQVEESKTFEAWAKLKVMWIWLWTEGSANDRVNNSHRIQFSLNEKWKFKGMKDNWGWLLPRYESREKYPW